MPDDLRSKVGKGYHLCWFMDCKAVWRLEDAEYCPACDTWRCPSCHRCYCDLPKEVQFALDAEGASSWGWDPWHNPPKRKRRSGGGVWVCSKCGRPHPESWVSEHGLRCAYCSGELVFKPFP
jgi:DNA-directed RNA polymerase subunit RPC12/RpoP